MAAPTTPGDLCQSLCEAMRTLAALDLNHGTSGNSSVRTAGGFLITPSGVHPNRLRPADVVALDVRGEVIGATTHGPSSEWRFHRDIYAARSDAGAVVHVHSPHATALSCHRRGLPPFHYMVAAAGGADVRCAVYATFGTQALSDAVLDALHERRACLLANHGLVALGDNLEQAIGVAVDVEALARQYLLAQALGEPVILPPEEMQTVIAKFRTYGGRHGEKV